MAMENDAARRRRSGLRARLVLMLVVVFVPSALLSAWWMELRHESLVDAALAEYAIVRMESGGREQAEAEPARFQEPPRRPDRPGGPDRPNVGSEAGSDAVRRSPLVSPRAPEAPLAVLRERPMLWAYTAQLASLNPDAPALPTEAKARARAGDEVVSWKDDYLGIDWRCVLVRMPWVEGPAVYVQVRRADERDFGPLGGVETLGTAFVLGVVLMLAAAWAAGPVVRRVRRLQELVQAIGGASHEDSVAAVVRAPPRGLGDELDELAHTFDEVSSRLREQTKSAARREAALRRFVENTTHDTGLPLTVLQMQLAALEGQVRLQRPVDPGRLRTALEEVHYLSALVQNLGAAAAQEAGVAQPARLAIDLGALVEKVAQRQRLVASLRGVHVETGTPEERLDVEGDPTAWEQALNNLVHNAVQHGVDGGHVAIVLEEDGAERFRLRVLDDGPGVSADELQRLERRSWRGDAARARHPDGRGLGLAIVRDMADQHGLALRFERLDPHGLLVELAGARRQGGASA
jgi:signal transduction histidine kinase